MSSEFGQIEQKIAEYEIARQELGKIDYNEKVDQIKKQLKYELMIEFLKADDFIVKQGDDACEKKRRQVRGLYYERVDPENSYDFKLRCNILEDSQKICDFFEFPQRIIDDLTWQSMEEITEVLWRRNKLNYTHMFLLPPPDPGRRISMAEAIREKQNIPIVLPEGTKSQWRPSYAYPLGFEYKNANIQKAQMMTFGIKYVDLAKFLGEHELCGLTLDEYLFLLADVNFIGRGDFGKVLFDERIVDNKDNCVEAGFNYDQLKFKPLERWDAMKSIFAINGWQWE